MFEKVVALVHKEGGINQASACIGMHRYAPLWMCLVVLGCARMVKKEHTRPEVSRSELNY
jgi:hypothetical protein